MKNNILDAWIMVEHLSEGDISLRDKKNLRLDDLTDKKYFDYFQVWYFIWIYLPLARWLIFLGKHME